jgi:dTDP-4-amino-4,6-dideoxygalactose transaminase
MIVPFLQLKDQYTSIKDKLLPAVEAVLESQQFILGPVVEECEKQIAAYCGCAHGIGVSSGTDALLMCLMAEGIGPGDEVLTTPYTFFATAGSITRVGAKPVFVDICPRTYNVDASQLERCITPRTKAIIPVHLFGQCADMDPILEIAQRYDLVVVEDAAQAIGARYKGHHAGSMGDYGCFSFFPSKNLGCAGDGGMVTTMDAVRADKLRMVRAHGSRPKYHHKMIGGNFRLDAIQAAVVNVKLRHLNEWTAARRANAARYCQLFEANGIGASGLFEVPYELPHGHHVYNQFVIRTQRRDELQAHLTQQGIGSEIYYPVAMHLQECFAYLGYKPSDFPESERAAQETIALPIYPELTTEQQRYVVESIRLFRPYGRIGRTSTGGSRESLCLDASRP